MSADSKPGRFRVRPQGWVYAGADNAVPGTEQWNLVAASMTRRPGILDLRSPSRGKGRRLVEFAAEPGGELEPERVQLDETSRIRLVVGPGIILERHNISVVKAV